MTKRFKIVGVSGLANSGKDLFYRLCAEELKKRNAVACRVGLADELKKECKRALKSMYDIDPTTCTREEKNKIRDHLIFHGLFRRVESEGKYWTSKADNKIKSLKRNCTINNVVSPVCFITDIRYKEYDQDETYWVQKKHKGLLVHLRKTTGTIVNHDGTIEKTYEEPVNKQEEENDPKLMEVADVCIEWPSCEGEESLIKTHLKPTIKDFVRKYVLK
jgi:hypothetical protein